MRRYRFVQQSSEELDHLADELPVLRRTTRLWRMTPVKNVFVGSPIQGVFDPIPSMSLFLVQPVTTLSSCSGCPAGVPDYLGADSEESPSEPLEIGVVKATFATSDRIGSSFRDPGCIPPTKDSFGYPRRVTWYRVPGVRSKFQRRSPVTSLVRRELGLLRIPA
jgi:hypothetical protein